MTSQVSLPNFGLGLPAYYVLALSEASSNLSRYDGVRYGSRLEGSPSTLSGMYTNTRGQGLGSEVKRRILVSQWRAPGRVGERNAFRNMDRTNFAQVTWYWNWTCQTPPVTCPAKSVMIVRLFLSRWGLTPSHRGIMMPTTSGHSRQGNGLRAGTLSST